MRGFSLVEVMVNLVIFGIMMSIAFFNYPKLTQALAFSNASNEVLSIIKSTQISGSSRGGDYAGDGVFFTKDALVFQEFLDIASEPANSFGVIKSNKLFLTTTAPTDLISRNTIIQNNVKVSDLCIRNSSDIIECGKTELSITFLRPSIAANITDRTETSPSSSVYNFYNKGYIELLQQGDLLTYKKCITVYNYGQIDLKSGACPLQE